MVACQVAGNLELISFYFWPKSFPSFNRLVTISQLITFVVIYFSRKVEIFWNLGLNVSHHQPFYNYDWAYPSPEN